MTCVCDDEVFTSFQTYVKELFDLTLLLILACGLSLLLLREQKGTVHRTPRKPHSFLLNLPDLSEGHDIFAE